MLTWWNWKSRLAAALAALAVCLAAPAQGAEMTFRIVTFGDPAKCKSKCPQAIAAEGEITERTPDAFIDFVATHVQSRNLRSIVLFHSPGGRVVASMRLGVALRKLGAAGIVARVGPDATGRGGRVAAARCYSACVYALMGARKRVVPAPSQVGIHRMFMLEALRNEETGAIENRTFATESLVSRLSQYADMMGVSNELVRTAEGINPDRIHILSARELRRWRLATGKL
ncbi:MAG: hypothetical protein Q7T73_18840 [Beijerinckiaceae bacterium]|nr:hypothetical protein [Beijerinckiaceae bacterium]